MTETNAPDVVAAGATSAVMACASFVGDSDQICALPDAPARRTGSIPPLPNYRTDPFRSSQTAKYRRRIFLRNPAIGKAQRKHFWLMDVLPTITSIVGASYLFFTGVRWQMWGLFAFAWVITALGIELGLHRYFTHRSYTCTPTWRRALHFFAILPGQGTVLAWSSNHRHHHRFSDSSIDTHSPYQGGPLTTRGLWHSHMGWKLGYPYPSPKLYARDLLKDKGFIKIDRMYFRIVLSWLIAFGVAGGLLTLSWEGALQGFLLAGVIRLTLTQHFTWAINSVCHWIGRQPHQTGDESRNNWLLALPTMGGSWHNNHHAFPHSGKCGMSWWQIDPAYWVLLILKRLKLVTGISMPQNNVSDI